MDEHNDDIERSLTTTYRRKIWSRFVQAIKIYQLIQPGDKICVCISGGKDSMLMAKLFKLLHKHTDFPFDVTYMVMDPGYSKPNAELIKKNLSILGIEADILKTDIFAVANAQDRSPCYLCAKMRRGALYRLAKDKGCNKIALGHHYDDVIETTLMNMLNAGSFQTMLPKLHSDNYEGMELIRPMYLIREADIIAWKKRNNLQFLQCACKFTEMTQDKNNPRSQMESKRLETKNLIKELAKTHPQLEQNIFSAGENVVIEKILAYKDGEGVLHSFLDTYDEIGKNRKANLAKKENNDEKE